MKYRLFLISPATDSLTLGNPRPENAILAAYRHMDTGTGRIRGASVFGPREAAAGFRVGGSDHASSSVTSLPGARIIPEDAEQPSTVAAALAWPIARRDQMVPRFTQEAPPPSPSAAPRPKS
jgi:hypothetical protein